MPTCDIDLVGDERRSIVLSKRKEKRKKGPCLFQMFLTFGAFVYKFYHNLVKRKKIGCTPASNWLIAKKSQTHLGFFSYCYFAPRLRFVIECELLESF